MDLMVCQPPGPTRSGGCAPPVARPGWSIRLPLPVTRWVDHRSVTPSPLASQDTDGRDTKLREYTKADRSAWQDTTYSYDDQDQLTKVTEPGGGEHTFTYDARGRQTSATDPAAARRASSTTGVTTSPPSSTPAATSW